MLLCWSLFFLYSLYFLESNLWLHLHRVWKFLFIIILSKKYNCRGVPLPGWHWQLYLWPLTFQENHLIQAVCVWLNLASHGSSGKYVPPWNLFLGGTRHRHQEVKKLCGGEEKKKRQEAKYFARIVAMFWALALEHCGSESRSLGKQLQLFKMLLLLSCLLPSFSGWGLNTNLPQQFRLNVTLSNIKQIRPRHVSLSSSITGECSSPCKRAGVGMGSVSSSNKFLWWVGRAAFMCAVCLRVLTVLCCPWSWNVSTYSVVTRLVKSVLENWLD